MFLNVSVLNTLNPFTDLKGPEENIICTMDDVRGDVLGAATRHNAIFCYSTNKVFCLLKDCSLEYSTLLG